jgi:hypothetical protein
VGSNGRGRDEHRRQRKQVRRLKKQRIELRHERGRAWPIDPPFIREVAMLDLAAPAIEAAGSVQQAAELNLLLCDAETLEVLKRFVPVSRGGTLSYPGAELEWQCVLQDAIGDRHVDRDEMQKMVQEDSRDQ